MGLKQGLADEFLDKYPHNIAVLDSSGAILWTNTEWSEFGVENGLGPNGDVTSDNYLDVVRAADDPYAERAEDGLVELLRGERSRFTLEYPCHGRDALRWFLLQAFNVEFSGERYCLVAHVDITEKKFTALLTEARQKMAKKRNEMLLHNIGNALMSATGVVERLQVNPSNLERIPQLEKSHTRIENSLDAARELFHLIQQNPVFDKYSVDELTRTAWESPDRENATLVLEDCFPIICYPTHTRALFRILFDNATRHSEGTVAIHSGTREFYIDDTRSEPIPEDLSRVFELRPVLEGGEYSFGLTLVRPLAHLHGWEISIENSPMGGWRFVIRTEQIHVDEPK